MTPRGGRAVFSSSFGVQSYALFDYCTSKQYIKQQKHSVLAQLFSFTQTFAKPIQQIHSRISPHETLMCCYLPAAPHAIWGFSAARHAGISENSASSYLCPSRILPFHGGEKTENFRQELRFFQLFPCFAPYTLQSRIVAASV